jgi:hypothetical protein
MATQKRHSDYVILLILGGVTALTLLALATMDMLSGQDESSIPSTYDTGWQGTKAYFTLLERLGTPAGRLESSPVENALRQVHVLFLFHPYVAINRFERRTLQDWVSQGGVLICDTAAAHGVFPDWHVPTDMAGEMPAMAWDPERDPVTPIPDEEAQGPLARDVQAIVLHGRGDLEELKSALAGSNSLLTDSVGPRVLEYPGKKGAVIVLADVSFLANGWIGREDNAILAMNLASYATARAGGGTILFDEYHLGSVARKTGAGLLREQLFKSSPGWAVLTLTLAGMMYLFYRGRRFGTRRGIAPSRRRSRMEFVFSLGATYRARKANVLTLQLLYRDMRSRLTTRLHLSEKATDTELAQRLSRPTGRTAASYQGVFTECEAALRSHSIPTMRFSRLLRDLGELEREAADGRD